MKQKFATRLCVFALLIFGHASFATAAACRTYISSSLTGTTPPQSTSVAVSPFTISCDGSFSGSLTILDSNPRPTLQLETQRDDGIWEIVDSGFIAYSGSPGTYRYTVKNESDASSMWSITYRKPSF
jgi:hypothetical protein